MAYVVDPRTLLFTDEITQDELDELQTFCTKLVLEGYVDTEHPAFRAWWGVVQSVQGRDPSAVGEEQRMMVNYVTAFPQRALLSIVL
jgi:hypothetical protein